MHTQDLVQPSSFYLPPTPKSFCISSISANGNSVFPVAHVQKVSVVLDFYSFVLTHILSEVYCADSTFSVFPECDHFFPLHKPSSCPHHQHLSSKLMQQLPHWSFYPPLCLPLPFSVYTQYSNRSQSTSLLKNISHVHSILWQASPLFLEQTRYELSSGTFANAVHFIWNAFPLT